jgi:hypothetical protein
MDGMGYPIFKTHSMLVGGFNHLEKYEFVNGKDDIPYMKRKIKFHGSKPPTRCQS